MKTAKSVVTHTCLEEPMRHLQDVVVNNYIAHDVRVTQIQVCMEVIVNVA